MSVCIAHRSLELRQGRTAQIQSDLFAQVEHFRFFDGGGRLETHNVTFPGNPIGIARVASSGHSIALTEEQSLTFLVPRMGRVEVNTRCQTWRAGKGGVLALRPGRRETVVRRGESQEFLAYVLFLPVSGLAESETGMSVPTLFGLNGGRTLAGERALRLQEYLAFAVEDMAARDTSTIHDRTALGLAALARDLLFELLEEAVLEDGALGQSALHHELAAHNVGVRRAFRARDILVARSDEPLSIADLAAELGVGLRSLQLCFLQTFGKTPRAVLTEIRLENARSRLITAGPDTQVTTVAMDSGFTHLSRFSEAYRRAFGERPVETLHRARLH